MTNFKTLENGNIIDAQGQEYMATPVGRCLGFFSVGCCDCQGHQCAFRDLPFREDCPSVPSCTEEGVEPFIWSKVVKQ